MSRENVECVRRLLRAFNDGDVEALVAECDPGVEWEEQSIPGVDPIFRGHDGVSRGVTDPDAIVSLRRIASVHERE
jgi:ketosteroid isomerase-like protein